MKKLFCLVLVLLICAVSACAEMDVSQMSTGDLVKLKESINMQLHADALREDSHVLFEDDEISVQYDGYTIETYSDSYIRFSFIWVNKSDRDIKLRYDQFIINGCTLDLEGQVDLPAGSVTINESVNRADTFIKYGIDEVDTLRLYFSDQDRNQFIGETISIEHNENP